MRAGNADLTANLRLSLSLVEGLDQFEHGRIRDVARKIGRLHDGDVLARIDQDRRVALDGR